MIEIVNRKQTAICKHCDTCFLYEDSDRKPGTEQWEKNVFGFEFLNLEANNLSVDCPACGKQVVVWKSESRIIKLQDES